MNLPEALLVFHILLLPKAIQGTSTQAPTVTSSLEQTEKEAACPGETVTFTCTTYGSPRLQWMWGDKHAIFSSPPDEVGKILNREIFNATLDLVNSSNLMSLLTIVFHVDYNGSHLVCSDGRKNATKELQAAGIPSPPTVFSEENRAPMCHHTDITFTWNPPEYSGKAIITEYTLNVSNSIYTTTGTELSPKDPLLNGINYRANLIVSNCFGDSSPVHLDLNITGCVSPPTLEGGRKNSSCTGENSVVKYHCKDGLMLMHMGGSEVTCMEDGNWSPNPQELSCKANCERLDHLNNGKVINGSNTLEDSVVSYSCNDGYNLHGTDSSTCGSNGMWSPDPSDNICRAVCMTPQAPNNGTVIVVNSLIEGAVTEYKCDEGLFPNGNMEATCTDTGNGGEWIPNPVNTRCGKEVTCKIPTSLLNGMIFHPNTTIAYEEDMIYFTCYVNEELINITEVCSSKGTWSNAITCEGIYVHVSWTAIIGSVTSIAFVSVVAVVAIVVIGLWLWRRRNGSKDNDCTYLPKLKRRNQQHMESVPNSKKKRFGNKGNIKAECLNMTERSDGLIYADLNPANKSPFTTTGSSQRVNAVHQKGEKLEEKLSDFHAVIYVDVEPQEESKLANRNHNGEFGSKNIASHPQGLVYADIGTATNINEGQRSQEIPNVQYSSILGTTTTTQFQDPIQITANHSADSKINLDTVLMQLQPVKHCWYKLGEALCVEGGTLDTIASQCGSQDECVVEMLDAWLRGSREKPTWRVVAAAVERIGHHDLAQAINRVYHTGELPFDPDSEDTQVALEVFRCPATGESAIQLPPSLPPKNTTEKKPAFPAPPPPPPPPPIPPKEPGSKIQNTTSSPPPPPPPPPPKSVSMPPTPKPKRNRNTSEKPIPPPKIQIRRVAKDGAPRSALPSSLLLQSPKPTGMPPPPPIPKSSIPPPLPPHRNQRKIN